MNPRATSAWPEGERGAAVAPLAQLLARMDELVDWERRARGRMQPSLAPIEDLLARIGQPQQRFRSVHVTGSKGKGSVCALVAAGLRAAGLRVGRYASPHVQRIHERIVLDGEPVTDEALAWGLSTVLAARDNAVGAASAGAQASWFDVMSACAFLLFAAHGVEWAVVEVGLGGRLDSTNVIDAELAVITNVALEHTEVLGRSVEAIAAQKAGIIKSGACVVTPIALESAAGRVIAAEAHSRHAALHPVALAPEATLVDANLATARQVLHRLGALGVQARTPPGVLSEALLDSEAIAQAALPARLEAFTLSHPRTGQALAVVLDGAHVPMALEGVLTCLRAQPRYRSAPLVLMALAADKDAQAMIRTLRGVAERLVFVALPDALPCWAPQQLQAIARAQGLHASTAGSPEQGLQQCLQEAAEHWLLITGSLRLAGALRGPLLALQGATGHSCHAAAS